MVEETKDLGGSVGGIAFAYGPVFDEIHVEMYRKAMQEHKRELEASELLEKLDMKGNTLTWDPKNPTNPDYLVPRPPKPALTEDERILEEIDKAIDGMTDEEKELLFNNREYMNPLKFCDWFIQNRPKSIYVDSFRKVRGHLKKMDSMSWRTPLDRDSIISRSVKTQYRLMRANSRKLKGNIPFYVVYGLMQKRDLYTGAKLSRPILEVGYATSPTSMRYVETRHKMTLLKALKLKSNIYFRIAYFNSLKDEGVIPKGAKFNEYFEAIPIDIAATKNQMKNLEIFYTIYVNRLNGIYSFNLDYNLLFNATVGNMYDSKKMRSIVDDINNVPIDPDEARFFVFASKEHLDSAIRLGLPFSDLMWYFRESAQTITKILNYYYPGRSWFSIRKEIMSSYLTHLAESGVTHQELVNYLFRSTLRYSDVRANYKDRSFLVNLRPYTIGEKNSLIQRYFEGFNDYNNILFESYLKPQLLSMAAGGFITKEKIIDVLRDGSQLPYIDSSDSAGVSGTAFRWIFQLLFTPDIMNALASKDYGVITSEDYRIVPQELLKDLDLYFKGESRFNYYMRNRLRIIIKAMFGHTDLSRIYRFLNTGTL